MNIRLEILHDQNHAAMHPEMYKGVGVMRTHSISQNRPTRGAESSVVSDKGTVLWIGERQAPEFREAYCYTEAASSQMAYRSDWTAALSRPACDVHRIIVAQVDRSPVPRSIFEQLANRYVDAAWLSLEGPLCAGVSRRQVDRPLADCCYLHQWRQSLPFWLKRTSDQSTGSASRQMHQTEAVHCSLGIIATDSGNANTLLELAASTSAAAVWLRSPSPQRMRNFDVIWWDDSAVGEASSDQWMTRLQPNRTNVFRDNAVHVWLTNTTRIDAADDAYTGGVALVLSKPFQVASLLQSLMVQGDCGILENVGSTIRSRVAA